MFASFVRHQQPHRLASLAILSVLNIRETKETYAEAAAKSRVTEERDVEEELFEVRLPIAKIK